jgi:hypothetical protein
LEEALHTPSADQGINLHCLASEPISNAIFITDTVTINLLSV